MGNTSCATTRRQSRVYETIDNSRPNLLVTKRHLISIDYKLHKDQIIGNGLSGHVIVCQHKETHKKYALKVIYIINYQTMSTFSFLLIRIF